MVGVGWRAVRRGPGPPAAGAAAAASTGACEFSTVDASGSGLIPPDDEKVEFGFVMLFTREEVEEELEVGAAGVVGEMAASVMAGLLSRRDEDA